MAGGRDRATWDTLRQDREQRVRRGLSAQGIEVPRHCSNCQAALEVLRDRGGAAGDALRGPL